MQIQSTQVKESESRAISAGLTNASTSAVAAPPLPGDKSAEAIRAVRSPAPASPDPEGDALRRRQLTFAGARPSPREEERILNGDDLVDEFYLKRAVVAAQPVCRIVVRNNAGRETGCATGFMIAPHLLLTNWHVFNSAADATYSVAEFDFTLNLRGDPEAPVRFDLRPDAFFLANKTLDYALVAVADFAQDSKTPITKYGYHKLNPSPNKIREREWITIIQHPGGARRQYSIRDNLVILKQAEDQFLWYQSDTAPGSSGAPAFNDSFQVVALHHLGRAKRKGVKYVLRDGTLVDSLDGIDDSLVAWEANEGLRVSVLVRDLLENVQANAPYAKELFDAMKDDGDVMTRALASGDRNAPAALPEVSSGKKESMPSSITPMTVTINIGANGATVEHSVRPSTAARTESRVSVESGGDAQPDVAFEKLTEPDHDNRYSNRKGYSTDFLGVNAPMPTLSDRKLVSKMENGKFELPYEHFSVVMNKARRLAYFTASNVAGGKTARTPEDGDYKRKGLTGLTGADQEKWFTDPRIPELHQLPDKFYTKDRQAFDKGHIVRREDVCWGKTYQQIKRANGDTYHTTNCSPQVKGFNRSPGDWGALENYVLGQVKADEDKYSIFSGPIFDADDPEFDGVDERGAIQVKIPQRFWKVVVASVGKSLQTWAFVLEQDLKSVIMETEFSVNEKWVDYLMPIDELEKLIKPVKFHASIRNADQFGATGGQEMARKAVGGPWTLRNTSGRVTSPA